MNTYEVTVPAEYRLLIEANTAEEAEEAGIEKFTQDFARLPYPNPRFDLVTAKEMR